MKERGAAPGLFQLLHFQALEPLAFFEAHLEIADQRHQKTDAQERHAHRAGGADGVTRDHRADGADQQQDDPVDGADFLEVPFHVQLRSRSSNSTNPSASEAPR